MTQIEPSPRCFTSLAELAAAVGEELGTTPWMSIDQDRIDEFAHATGDYQWIHTDNVRASAGPFGATIAHGYLTLALLPQFAAQILSVEFGSARLNYGLNKVRFPQAVRVGTRLRARARLLMVTPNAAGSLVSIAYTIDIENEDKPACIAETLMLVVHAAEQAPA